MSYEKVIQAKKICVGTKQTVKAIKSGQAKEVIVAKDVDEKIVQQVIKTAEEYKVPLTYVDSKKSLGKACRIEVSASTVAIIH